MKPDKIDRILSRLRILNRIPGINCLIDLFYGVKPSAEKIACAGMTFDYPVGVAGGIDASGEFCGIAASSGASFVEIGPVEDVDATIDNLRRNPSPIPVLAVLPGKEDERVFALLYDFVDAVVFDITETEVDCDSFERILQMRIYNDEYKPVFFRIPPYLNMPEEKIDEVMDYALGSGVDGIMVPRKMLGKVVGMALGHLDIICCGHFDSASEVVETLKAGAKAVAITDRPGEIQRSFIKNVIKNI